MNNTSIKTGNLFDKKIRKQIYQETAYMFKIVRIPSKLKPFFDTLQNQFHFNHFQYFQTLVLLMAFSYGRRNIAALYRHLDSRGQPHRSRFNNFLNVGRCNYPAVLHKKAYELLRQLSPCRGDVVELILDDSKNQKRGKTMQAVGWIHDPLTGRNIRGHQYITATIRFRGHTIPFGVRIYIKKQDCQTLERDFKKTTELAAELISEFKPPEGVKVTVLFDSYYLCPVVVKSCRNSGFHFISTLKSNRNLFKNGRKLKVGKYGKSLFRNHKKSSLTIRKSKGPVKYTYVDAGWLNVNKLGRLHVVFSRKNSEPGILGLVTDEPAVLASQIIRTYDDRWSIEVFFKDGKQLLGLGQYQNVSLEAAVTHLHLVCFAYALLTHVAISREGAQAKCKTKARPSTAVLQDEVRRIVWDDLTDYLKRFSSGTQIFKELEKLLVAA
jgi:Transposase DDE domain